MHIRNDPSFFLTNRTGAPQGEELGLIKPLSDSSFSCSDKSFIPEGSMQTPGSGISILLAVGTPSTGSGNLYCQWELSPGIVPPPLSGDYTSLSDHIDLVTSLQRSTQMTLPPMILVSNIQSTSQMILPHVHQLLVATHLIKDCDFYKKQMANKTVGIGEGPIYRKNKENHFLATEDEGIFNSGCSRSMTGNIERLDDFQAFQGGKVTFGGGEGRITEKGTIQTPTLDFKNVYYVKELHQFNLFSISQICDKQNRFLFTDTEFLMLSKDFKLPDDSVVVLKVPRKHNLYTINLNDLCPMGNLACLVAHASFDESVKWHRRMGHVNYKNINRLVKAHKNETYHILKDFINLVENQLNKKVKAIRCDNGIDFKNAHMIELCGSKRIKREYSNPRTPKENRVAERKNKALIEVARTMLADSKLPTMFWTEAIRTACYVLNRVSITSPHIKTPYALLTGHIPSVGHLKPFGCHVTILNTSDHLGKFDGKADEGYIIGYSISNKAYRVYNVPNERVEESINLQFLKEKPNVQGLGHECIQRSEPKDTFGDEVDDSPFQSAGEIFQKELAKLKDQEQRALEDPSWIDAMQEEIQQFKFQNIWVLVDLPAGKNAIRTKWILKNKRDARGIVTVRLFLVFASYMGFLVYQMDVKSAFLYGRIDEEVYVTQPKGFVDPQHPKKVYKVVKTLYGLHQALRVWKRIRLKRDKFDQNRTKTGSMVKEYQEKDKIGSKPDKNGKRGEARKSQKQLQ
nr:ribonuclease H-like domain-containing protein [Tanacetum cinerariifolium]